MNMVSLPSSFSFLVLAFNHEDYILEHLESIKYLVERYGSSIDVEIIFNDDLSTDKTVEIADTWLNVNSSIFSRVVKIYNHENLGTCSSLVNMIREITSEACKMTAGDDVYSFENIFEYGHLSDNCAILSGIPLYLRDSVLSINKSDVFHIVASDVINSGNGLGERFKGVGVINSPSLIYEPCFLKDEKLLSFLSGFDVVEDRAIWLSMANLCPDRRFDVIDKVFVYYRRTLGSTYMVAGSRVYADSKKYHEYLVSCAPTQLQRLLLNNRFYCYKLKNRILKKVLNFSLYLYFFRVLGRITSSFSRYSRLDLKLDKHVVHYQEIQAAAHDFSDRNLTL
ncbi:MAG: glycosyltransferase family 2 protein [Actinobacteria bacterium]|nr:glycosyltransferase family 2 protein [Actinomycetota bacterium]